MAKDPVVYSENLQSGLTINSPTITSPVIQSGIISLNAATTLTAGTHAGRIMKFNTAAGVTATLPAATGSGNVYRFLVGTTVTSVADIVAVADATDAFVGTAHVAQDGGDTSIAFEAGADSDHISLNGSTTGGIAGDQIEVIDSALNVYHALVFTQATGTEATPFLTGQVS